MRSRKKSTAPVQQQLLPPPMPFDESDGWRRTMGVRPKEPQGKHKINKVIAENQPEINAILQSYGVPLLDQNGDLIEPGTAER